MPSVTPSVVPARSTPSFVAAIAGARRRWSSRLWARATNPARITRRGRRCRRCRSSSPSRRRGRAGFFRQGGLRRPRAATFAVTCWISIRPSASIAARAWISGQRTAVSCPSGARSAKRRRSTAPTLAEFFQDRARLAIDQDQCVRCGECADVCPVQCIRIRKVVRLPGGRFVVRAARILMTARHNPTR